MSWFEVLAGRHTESTDASGAAIIRGKGDRFFSSSDLRKWPEKFRPCEPPRGYNADGTPTESSSQEELPEVGNVDRVEELALLTVAELQHYAQDNGVDITGVHKKADIIAAIVEQEAE